MPVLDGTTIPYQKCVLDGYTYEYNPRPTDTNPLVKTVVKTPGLSTNVFTDFGFVTSDREIVQVWASMQQPVYKSLETKFIKAGVLSFTDCWGQVFTVIFDELTYDGITPLGVLYLNVRAKFYVLSSP